MQKEHQNHIRQYTVLDTCTRFLLLIFQDSKSTAILLLSSNTHIPASPDCHTTGTTANAVRPLKNREPNHLITALVSAGSPRNRLPSQQHSLIGAHNTFLFQVPNIPAIISIFIIVYSGVLLLLNFSNTA